MHRGLKILLPTSKPKVIDLVRSAGIDVSDWYHSKGRADSNPKYCYEWSFVDDKTIVLNFWFDNLMMLNETNIGIRINIKDLTEERSQTKNQTLAKRAARMHVAIRSAYSQNLPVRIIICTRTKRHGYRMNTSPYQVKHRKLDPMPWHISIYSEETGMAELVRGIQHTKLIDQFAADDVSTFPKKISHQSNVFVRNPLIREKALKRAGGICECCGTIGFITSSNGIFLETHHIIPLANQGEDSMNNISAICPNCHRRAHLGIDAGVIADKLKELRKNVK